MAVSAFRGFNVYTVAQIKHNHNKNVYIQYNYREFFVFPVSRLNYLSEVCARNTTLTPIAMIQSFTLTLNSTVHIILLLNF